MILVVVSSVVEINRTYGGRERGMCYNKGLKGLYENYWGDEGG